MRSASAIAASAGTVAPRVRAEMVAAEDDLPGGHPSASASRPTSAAKSAGVMPV